MENKKRKTKSISVTVPIGWKAIIDQQARAEGRSRSHHIAWLVRRYIAIAGLQKTEFGSIRADNME